MNGMNGMEWNGMEWNGWNEWNGLYKCNSISILSHLRKKNEIT
jgi:hypothetical protein